MAFEAMTRDELKKLAERNNIYIPSKYNKEDMIDAISEFFNKKKKRNSKRLSVRTKTIRSKRKSSYRSKSPKNRNSVRNMNYAPINYAPINYAPVNYNNIVNNYYSAPEIKEIAKINKIKTPADATKKELIEIVNAVLNDRLRNKSPIKLISPKATTPKRFPSPKTSKILSPKSPQKQQKPKSPQKQQVPQKPKSPQKQQAPQKPKSPQKQQVPQKPKSPQQKPKSPTPKAATPKSIRSKSPKALDVLPPLQPVVPFSEVLAPAPEQPKLNRQERRELERKERREREEKARLEREAKAKLELEKIELEKAESKLEQDIENEVSENKIEKDVEKIEKIEEEIKSLKKSIKPATPKIFTPRRKESPVFVIPDIPVFEPVTSPNPLEQVAIPVMKDNELKLVVLPVDQNVKSKSSKVRSLPRIIGPRGENI